MSCPICGRKSTEACRPFCSDRCKDVDLARWFTGGYAVPSQDPDDIEEAIEQAMRAAEETESKPH
ncbi:DNA gyrase inhibitor YacG [Litorivita pollutaquae]|uniref:DNA gyrase inhibitor YacG n=1 Tax=Litorivita pollutaquae TaxID=2200892 RepID=A0A2V4N8T9_9RHOB|nr:DNA gyrase inhibitor YacG [Litorivita pollutaquae]PYC46443.1 DNA gyrase inhibitor YacG [Litorivita pollutaquae]